MHSNKGPLPGTQLRNDCGAERQLFGYRRPFVVVAVNDCSPPKPDYQRNGHVVRGMQSGWSAWTT